MKTILYQLVLLCFFYGQTKTEKVDEKGNSYVKTIELRFDKVNSNYNELRFEASMGEIELIKSDKSYPYVVTRIVAKVSNKQDAEELFNQFRMESETNDKRINAFFEDRINQRYNYDRNRYFRVTHSIFISDNKKIDCRTSGGSISGNNLTNIIKGKTSGGNIKFKKISGSIDINTSGGNIDISNVVGNIEARTSGGNITVFEINGKLDIRTSGGEIVLDNISDEVDAQTSGGNIEATNLENYAQLKTSGGNVKFKKIKNGLTAKTSGGNIRGSDVSGLSVLETSGGDINVKELKGPVEAENGSGDIDISINLENYTGNHNSFISTNNGDVIVEISESSSFEAQLYSRSYSKRSRKKIRSDFDLDYRGKRARASNKGGKHKIQIETSGGEIRLLKKN